MRPLRATDATPGPAGLEALLRRFRFARDPLDEIRAALAMLTRLPLRGSPGSRTGARAYAVVGAFLGLAAVVPLLGFGHASPVVSAILAVGVLAILSGGLHLDGLADTFDALVAVGPDGAERARRDPAVGAAGATALILIIGIDVATLAELLVGRGVVVAGFACLVAAVVSRAVPVVLARIDAAAPDGGLGAWFVGQTSGVDAAVVAITGLAIASAGAVAIGQPVLALAGPLAGAGSVGLGVALVRVRGQLDGDGLGASVELGFATTLLVTAALAAGLPS